MSKLKAQTSILASLKEIQKFLLMCSRMELITRRDSFYATKNDDSVVSGEIILILVKVDFALFTFSDESV